MSSETAIGVSGRSRGAAQQLALAVLQALGNHRAVQIEHDAVKAALRHRLADRVSNVREGGILDRPLRRRARRDRQDDLRPFPLGQIEIGAEAGAGAAIGADRRLAIERPRAMCRTAPAASAPARRCWSRASSSRSTSASGPAPCSMAQNIAPPVGSRKGRRGWVLRSACGATQARVIRSRESVMQRSTDRILTTHAGSLPRDDDLGALIRKKPQGEAVDEAPFAARVTRRSTSRAAPGRGRDRHRRRWRAGPGRLHPLRQRAARRHHPEPDGRGGELLGPVARIPGVPGVLRLGVADAGAAGQTGRTRWVCTGPVSYKGHGAVAARHRRLQGGARRPAAVEAFMPAVSPSNLANWNRNEHYKTRGGIPLALADALREEYKAIIDAGLVLQIDDPLLASYYVMHPETMSRSAANGPPSRVEVLNHALRGLPVDRIRYHTCYSINIGPRVHDLELKDIVDIMLGINAGAISFEAANPRHEHEWTVWESVKLPEGKVLIPGVITHSSNVKGIRHPTLH